MLLTTERHILLLLRKGKPRSKYFTLWCSCGPSRRRGNDYRPGVQYRDASATPPAFRDALLDMARTASSEVAA